jgi:hypothetical protein
MPVGDDRRRTLGSGVLTVDATLVTFGEIEIDGRRYTHDVVVEGGQVRKRRKRPSKAYRHRFGHTPLSVDEAIPWSAPRLLIGTGASGQLPVMAEVQAEADRRGVELVAVPTGEACELLTREGGTGTTAILHVTC